MTNTEDHDRSIGAANSAETAPLLGTRPPRRSSHRPTHSVGSIASLSSVHVPKVHNGTAIINFLCIIILISTSAGGFTDTPLLRIIEDTLCRDYYSNNGSLRPDEQINEKMCKVNVIQTHVQDILSILAMLVAIVGFFAAFPWGLAADRLGRKPVVLIAIMGLITLILIQMIVLYFHNVFPIRLIWLSSAGIAIGGGSPVLLAIILSIVTDAKAEKDRAIAFMYIHVASMCGNLISPTLSSLMMERMGPWPCIWVGIALLTTSAVLFLFLPETLHHKQRQEDMEETESPGMKSRITHTLDQFKESLSLLKSVSLLLLILSVFTSIPISYATLYFMAQFLSLRYGIKLSQTGYVQSTYGVFQLIQAFIILPWISKVLLSKMASPKPYPDDEHHREHDREHHRDLVLARWSGVFLVIGSLILGLSPTLPGFIFGLVLMALGSAYSSLARSMMSLFVDPEHTSRLFTLVGMVEVLGNAYTPPFMATLFNLGINLGGAWIGLPYYGLSLLIVISIAFLLFVRLTKHIKHSDPVTEGVEQAE